MALSIEGVGTWIFGPEWSIDGRPREAQNFEEFLALSRQARAGSVRAHMSIGNLESGEFDLSAAISSWRGDQADMVVLREMFDERIRDLEGVDGRILELRLLKTVLEQLESVGKILPRSDRRINLSIPGIPEVDLNSLIDALSKRPKLEPLVPKSPQVHIPSVFPQTAYPIVS